MCPTPKLRGIVKLGDSAPSSDPAIDLWTDDAASRPSGVDRRYRDCWPGLSATTTHPFRLSRFVNFECDSQYFTHGEEQSSVARKVFDMLLIQDYAKNSSII